MLTPMPPTGARRILLAEDEARYRRILSHYLTAWGFSVSVAQDGLEAVDALTGPDSPALALVDWVMPGLEGPDVCRRVRQLDDRPYTYIILLTAKADKGEVAAGFEAGADDYVTKPCDMTELRARLKVGERMVNLERTLAQQVNTLQSALDHVRELKELLPICAWCKRVRDDKDYWHSIEEYLHVHTGTDFTHGICPHCVEAMRETAAV